MQTTEKRRGAIGIEHCYGSGIILVLHFSSLYINLILFPHNTQHNTFSFVHSVPHNAQHSTLSFIHITSSFHHNHQNTSTPPLHPNQKKSEKRKTQYPLTPTIKPPPFFPDAHLRCWKPVLAWPQISLVRLSISVFSLIYFFYLDYSPLLNRKKGKTVYATILSRSLGSMFYILKRIKVKNLTRWNCVVFYVDFILFLLSFYFVLFSLRFT